jgi:glycosyltransferase involved in cell wall biosynthesis
VIRNCVDSVLNQDFKGYEVIIIDDNGKGTSEQLLTEKAIIDLTLKGYVNYVVLNNNGNGARARNVGIRLANGRYVAFLDDDDEWLPTRLSDHYRLLSKYNELEGSYSRIARYRRGELLSESTFNKSGDLFVDLLMLRSEMFTSSLIIRTDILREIGGFDERLKRHQDYDLLCKYFGQYKIHCIDKVLVKINADDRSNMPVFNVFEENKLFFLRLFEGQISALDVDVARGIHSAHFTELEFYAIRTFNIIGIIKYIRYFKVKVFFSKLVNRLIKVKI